MRRTEGRKSAYHGTASAVHFRALGDLVDNLPVGPQGDADRVGFGGNMLGEYGTVGFITLGAEHLLDIGNRVDAPIIGTVANIG